ncbi:MAG: serine hydrolase [Rhodothermia bacterium]|nr:serine hydrolase [Rhodothermia bacterium]
MQKRGAEPLILMALLILCAGPVGAQPVMGLHEAALRGNLDAVRQHINAGTNLDQIDAYGSTALIVATTFGNTEAAQALIEGGANTSIANNEGAAPIHVAALLGRIDILQSLLDNDVNRHQRTNEGATAYDIVAAPFEEDVWLYDQLSSALSPLGLNLDYDSIRAARPSIARLLRPSPDDLASVGYEPVKRHDWAVSNPADQGLDEALVAELYLDASELETIYSLLMVKNGHLIAEKYFNEGAIDQTARLQSVTKSYTSALVGLAMDKGCLTNLDARLVDFFPGVADRLSDNRKREITLRHLLRMRSGYPWEESDPSLWDGLLSGRYPRLVSEFPLVADPGTEFHYSNLSSNWLGIIVSKECGMRLMDFGQQYLFSRIGARPGPWGTDAYGNNNGCADLHMTARDAARFGLLYLNDGEYEEEQVVPAEWVRESLKTYSRGITSGGVQSGSVGRYHRDVGYGYHWWSARVANRRFNFAWGHGGQFIILLDDLEMVMVVTAKPFYLQHDSQAWKHEKSNLNLVGKFIALLPEVERAAASQLQEE